MDKIVRLRKWKIYYVLDLWELNFANNKKEKKIDLFENTF